MTNKKYERIGMIVATTREILPVFAKLGKPVRIDNLDGYEINIYRISGRVFYIVQSGAGEIYAAATTRMLIDRYSVDMIINIGICGGLTSNAALFETAVVNKVVHYDFDTSAVDNCEPARYQEYPDVYISVMPEALAFAPKNLKRVICASGDKFIADSSTRYKLNKLYKAEICEMEAAGILLTSNKACIPALLVKIISDSFEGGADEYQLMADKSADICAGIIQKIVGGIK